MLPTVHKYTSAAAVNEKIGVRVLAVEAFSYISNRVKMQPLA